MLDPLLCLCNNLFQVINEPTRITQNGATIFDLIITNCPRYVVGSGTLSPPTNCDHSLIFVKMNMSFSKQKCHKRLIKAYNGFNIINKSIMKNLILKFKTLPLAIRIAGVMLSIFMGRIFKPQFQR